MPRVTRRAVFTILSGAYLLALTVLAAYALHRANSFSLPMAKGFPAFTVALPLLAGILYESIFTFRRKLGANSVARASIAFQVVTAVLLVYEAVLATLAGTHISPHDGLNCSLRDRWMSLKNHNGAQEIRQIQDSFTCCGYNTVKDMAWPFQDDSEHHTARSCSEIFNRHRSCREPWTAEQRKVAIMLLAVAIGVFLWKVMLILAPNLDVPWLPSAIRLPNDTLSDQDIHRQRVVEYRDAEEQTDDGSVRNEVDRLNQDANRASYIEGGRIHPSPLVRDRDIDIWRRT